MGPSVECCQNCNDALPYTCLEKIRLSCDQELNIDVFDQCKCRFAVSRYGSSYLCVQGVLPPETTSTLCQSTRKDLQNQPCQMRPRHMTPHRIRALMTMLLKTNIDGVCRVPYTYTNSEAYNSKLSAASPVRPKV